MTVDFRVKCAYGDEVDITVSVPDNATVDAVISQVCAAKNVPAGKYLRILCAGKELYSDDLVTKAPARVLHCMLTETAPCRPAPVPEQPPKPPAPPPPPPPVIEPPPVDWLDVVDPGTVLMWIFGSILALLWLLFVFYSHMFDRTSVVMLVMMTVAFLIPCVLSYLPWLGALQPQPQQRPGPPGPYDPAYGRSTAVQNGGWQRHPYAGDIPPRPPARVRPGS